MHEPYPIMALLFSGKFTLSPDLIWEQVFDDTILLNVKTLAYIRLYALSARAWRLLLKHDDVEAVFRALKDEQDLPEDRLEQFLNRFLDNFQRAQLITFKETA
jgi:hypothetical protein